MRWQRETKRVTLMAKKIDLPNYECAQCGTEYVGARADATTVVLSGKKALRLDECAECGADDFVELEENTDD